MPTDFASYDLNQDNIISPEEWATFYPQGGGPATDAPYQPPTEKPPGMPDAIWQMISPYYYQMTPDDILATGQAQVNMSIEQQLQEQQYQKDYLSLKQQELGLSADQTAQAQREFGFQSGPYWDFFSGDYFEFQKQVEANKVTMSNNQAKMSGDQVAISGNQVLQSEQDIDKSKNYALAQQYQTDAAKAQSEAAILQAYASMGLVNLNPPPTPQPRIQGAGNPFRY